MRYVINAENSFFLSGFLIGGDHDPTPFPFPLKAADTDVPDTCDTWSLLLLLPLVSDDESPGVGVASYVAKVSENTL